jgi:autotransporter-associated beta strand protein
MFRFRILAALVLLSVSVGGAIAQTFSWTSNASGNWSSASNWTGGIGPSAGGGSSVTLAFTNSATLIPTPATIYTATNDFTGNFLLNSLVLDTQFGAYTSASYLGLSLGGTNAMEFVSNGGVLPTITMSGAAVRLATPAVLTANTTVSGSGTGHLLWTGTISGGGQLVINRPSGLTGGSYTLGNQLGFYGGQTIITGNNTFSGGVTLNGGNLSYSILSAGNTPLGTGTVTVNGTATSPATIRMDSFSSNALPNNFQLNSTLYYTGTNSGTFSGTIAGSGDWVASGLNNTFLNPLTMTGRLIADGGPFRSSSGTIILRDNATALNVAGIVIGPSPGGGLTFDNTGTANLSNRVASGLVVQSSRAILTLSGNASAASSQTLGGLSGTGYETVSITSGAATQASTMTFSDATPITRQNSMMLFARGVNLGQLAPGTANAQNLVFTTPATFTSQLIGNSANLDSTTATDVPVLPWGVGVLAATGNPNQAAGTLLTYHSTNGVRPLPVAQFATSITDGSTSQNNVRLTGGAVTLNSATTINSLVIANASGTGGTAGSGTLTISSNTLLAVNTTASGVGNLMFGGEGYVTTFGGGLTFNGTVSAPSLVKAGTGILTISGAAPLNVPGPLTIQVGQVSIDTEAALGNVSELRLNGGILRVLNASSTVTLSKPIFVSNLNGGISTGNAGTSTTTDTVVNSVVADMPWRNTAGGTVTTFLPGQSAGSLQLSGFGNIFLNAANTYSANTILSASATVVISQEANLGTGAQINMEGAATLRTTASFAMTKALVLNGGTGNMTLAPDTGTTLSWVGPIHQRSSATQAFPLTKGGAGTLVIASTQNTFQGLLNINAGVLRLTGTLAPLNSAGLNPVANENYGVIVNPGATLSGTGDTNRVVFVDGTGLAGTIAPGLGGSGALATTGARIEPGAIWRIGISDASTPATANSGNSTIGPTFSPTSNGLLVNTAGVITVDPLANIVVDGTGVGFTLNSPYSYVVARKDVLGSISSISITDQARFSTVGFSAVNLTLTSDANTIYLNFIPVPEPLFALPIAVAGLVLSVVRKRKR